MLATTVYRKKMALNEEFCFIDRQESTQGIGETAGNSLLGTRDA